MKNISITEISEDFFQIIELLKSSIVNNDSSMFSKQMIFENEYNKYEIKYGLNEQARLIWNYFEKENFNYYKCSEYIHKVFFEPISDKYLRYIEKRYPLITNKEKSIIYKSCFSKIKKIKNKGWVNKRCSENEHLFLSFCTINKNDKFNNFNNLKKEFANVSLNNKKILLMLLKYQKQIIKELNDSGFINLLIYHEEKKEHSVLVKENIIQSFMDLNGDLNDTLVLFTFWVNKYVKFLRMYRDFLSNTNIIRYIFNNTDKYNNNYYKDLLCSLNKINIKVYNELFQKYNSLNHSIKQLYEIKDFCINQILRLERNRNELNYLTLKVKGNEKIIYYENPKTNIFASFHIKEEGINSNYLKHIKVDDIKIKPQSIPNEAKKKILSTTQNIQKFKQTN